jgi:hypothetical protein
MSRRKGLYTKMNGLTDRARVQTRQRAMDF